MKKIVFGLLAVVLLSGCLKKGDDTCNYDPCSYKVPQSEIQAVKDYLASQGINNAQEHCSGLFYVIQNAGTGKQPTACSAVDVKYVGMLTNGTVFDQSQSYQTYLYTVVQGWANGIPLLKEGGSIRLYIPPSLGYRDQPTGPIPANSILVFDVTLNAVL